MIAPPPLDNQGSALPHDHPEIYSEDHLIRRISKEYIVEKNGRQVISSMAYKAYRIPEKITGMSVDIKKLIEEAGLDVKDFVTTPRWIGSVLLTVSDIRSLGYQIGFEPKLDPGPDYNPYHGEVWGRFTDGDANKMKRLAVWFVAIPDVNLI